ncbi:hypothetical protein TVAG_173360 [Trichomonas vaginalis G3]|uniref:Uncharacterized protein n=1 Tax=Trichomonas vaginalis (strain ATCC PRA-98 / G3) TaxID=412133 RepID=A2G3G9_TRIV3|nr:hypothetical protein TVAG_173360 [Trichomonas vaginalis G3]|eukprot:XP_001301227.1 hypothetical protein [Trichomonas vaginalis G3]
MVTDMSGNLSEKAREYLNRSIEEKYSNRLQTSLPHVITFCYLAAISRLDNCDSLFNKFKEIASKIPDVIPNSLKNYQEIIVNPLKQYDAIFDKESELAKVINNACIEIRNIVAVGEYMLLEAVIHDEVAQITSHTMFYPTKYSQISMISTKIPKFTRKMLNQEENCSSN